MASTNLIIFGSTGDLSRQKLFPTLFGMLVHGLLTNELKIIAIGRRPYSIKEFRQEVRTAVEKHSHFTEEIYQTFETLIDYVQMDFHQGEDFSRLTKYLANQKTAPTNRVYYLAVPPESYSPILSNLRENGLAEEIKGGWSRVVLEKPFGYDLASAQKLNQQIQECFGEERVFRIDHYLGKETVQNILAFRFANGVFEPLWNNQHIDHIQITVAEEEGIGSRGNFYDKTGAIRDVLQNHLIQLLAVLTIEEPTAFTHQALSDEKVKIISQLKIDPSQTILGQYDGYLTEPNVHPQSQTETYVMSVFTIDTDRWRGVPIYARTGKKLTKRVSEVSVQFKQPRQHLFRPLNEEKKANILTFRLQPDEGIGLQLGVKTPRHNLQVQSVLMEFCYGPAFRLRLPDAYERLFVDILSGDKTLALRRDTVEESWKAVEDLLKHHSDFPLRPYSAGSWGPKEAEEILGQEGLTWYTHESQVCNSILLES